MDPTSEYKCPHRGSDKSQEWVETNATGAVGKVIGAKNALDFQIILGKLSACKFKSN